MMPALLLSALLPLAASAAGEAPSPALKQAQADFNRGNFPATLRDLDVAAGETSNAQQLAQIFLLRGQTYAALRDPNQTERSYERALGYDPEARLDPARVDPTQVSLLESLRERLKGELRVDADSPSALISVDGKPFGASPVQGRVSIGRHTIEAQSADGRLHGSTTVVVYPKRSTSAQVHLASGGSPAMVAPAPAPTPSTADHPEPTGHPLADVRLGVAPLHISQGLAVEVGGGFAWSFLRASLSARIFPDFGAIPRGGVAVPLNEHLHGFVELEMPIIFPSGDVAIGLGGSAGIEYSASAWLSLFGQVGARYYFTGNLEDRIPVQAGARLQVP